MAANKKSAPASNGKKKLEKSEPAAAESSLLRFYNALRYHVVPPFFVVLFTLAVQFLAQQANPSVPFQWNRILGNFYSWKVVAVFLTWALIFLRIPSRIFKGPVTTFGYVPHYADNGFFYYISSLITYLGLHVVYPRLSIDIFDNMPYILGSLNIFAFTLCSVLLLMGKWRPQTCEKLNSSPLMYEFYRGMEIHPRLMGVDVKQWTNCRVGMMAWQILIVAFLLAGDEHGQGLNWGHLANVVIQTVYIAKFFWWETGYFNTLDITLDRAGYYICWGCLVWVPAFYTYSSFYLVVHQSTFTSQTALVVGLLGLASVFINYRVDYEKQLFRTTKGNCRLYGKPAKSMAAVDQKTKRTSNLLLSGCWGLARHLNYTFEILAAFMWCFPGWGHGLWPFLYAIFLVGLLVHRLFRDEEKCSAKYGHYWSEYCKRVPYRMIPYVF